MIENRYPLYCDVLPIHPPLESFESLLSYCTRLGQKNLIKSVAGIATLLFPEINKRQILNLSDLPPTSIKTMALATNQPEERILESTLYNIGINFCRSTQPQALSRFLNGALNYKLKYCPLCIKENQYYSIFWRFQHIKVCEKHGCKLLENCSSCGKDIPLFFSPFNIGICPYCKFDLAYGLSNLAKTDEIQLAKSNVEDLKLFLKHERYPNGCSVGNVLRVYRLYLGEKINQIANNIEVSKDKISGFELNRVDQTGLYFTEAIKYLNYFNKPFHEIITCPLFNYTSDDKIIISTKLPTSFTPKENNRNSQKRNCANSTKKEILRRRYSTLEISYLITKAKSQLTRNGESISYTKVFKKIGISRNALYVHPELRGMWPSIKYKIQRNNTEINLAENIELISDKLINSKTIITFSLIANLLNVSVDTLRYYPQIREKINAIILQQSCNLEKEYLLKLKVLSNDAGVAYTQALKYLQISPRRVKHYPEVVKQIKLLTELVKKNQKNNPKRIAKQKVVLGKFFSNEGVQIQIISGE